MNPICEPATMCHLFSRMAKSRVSSKRNSNWIIKFKLFQIFIDPFIRFRIDFNDSIASSFVFSFRNPSKWFKARLQCSSNNFIHFKNDFCTISDLLFNPVALSMCPLSRQSAFSNVFDLGIFGVFWYSLSSSHILCAKSMFFPKCHTFDCKWFDWFTNKIDDRQLLANRLDDCLKLKNFFFKS